MARSDHGCRRCWPADAEAAWEARAGLAQAVDLIDESHFHVMMLACRRCRQRYLSVFTESIDWADGEDPQDWRLYPLTSAEADDLVARKGSLSETDLIGFDSTRRCLHRIFAKGASAPTASWTTGLTIGPHD